MKDATSLSGVNQPTEDQIINALAKQLQAPPAVVLSWLTTFARHFDPRAAAERLAQRETDGDGHPLGWSSK